MIAFGPLMDNNVLPKWSTAMITVGILAVSVGFHLSRLRFHKSFTMRTLCFCIATLCIALSMCGGEMFVDVFMKVLWLTSLCLLFDVYRDSRLVKVALRVVILIYTVYLMSVALFQIFEGKEHITSTYDSSVGLSLSICFSTIYGISIVNDKLGRYKVIGMAILLAFSTFILAYIGSRTGLFALATAVLLFWGRRMTIPLICISIAFAIMLTCVKLDSTKGRAFIYSTTISMLDNPHDIIVGRGTNGFRNSYMPYQAKALRHASDKERQLADNIKLPLNEGLNFIIDYGLLRAILLVVILFFTLRYTFLSRTSKAILAVIVTFSMFTYPFRYPVAWIVSASLLLDVSRGCTLPNIRILSIPLLVTVGLSLIAYATLRLKWNKEWFEAYQLSQLRLEEKSLTKYERLSSSVFAGSAFFYNYASVLHSFHESKKSIDVLRKCRINDYDTQLLYGDISRAQEKYEAALWHYGQALSMCPNRIIPLYAMYNIYGDMGNEKEKLHIRQIILNKKAKIRSRETDKIKNRVEQNK